MIPDVPPISANLRSLRKQIETGELPDHPVIVQLFDEEYEKLLQRDSMKSDWERVRYDLDNSKILHDRFDNLIILTLLLGSRKKFDLLIDFHVRREDDHSIGMMLAGVKREDRNPVSNEQSCILIKRDMGKKLAELKGGKELLVRLEMYCDAHG